MILSQKTGRANIVIRLVRRKATVFNSKGTRDAGRCHSSVYSQ